MFEDVEVRFDVVVEEGERVIHVIFLLPLSSIEWSSYLK
jgi:hypothetical protein